MPTYSYYCASCGGSFELFSYIKDYNESPKCSLCQSKKTQRNYVEDAKSQSSSVKKADSELKTIGDLAMRNTERMSEDQKTALYMKHNSYKEDNKEPKPLPSGMSRVKKQQKVKWPGTQGIPKRRNFKK